ncbi:MAG: DUF4332 domain-containing protein [Rubripirellula sp.]
MLLDRIDIDAHGPLNRVELGPFAEHLNVVCSPEGSGKTAIVRFIRDSLVDRDYPLGMLSSSGGRIVWADRNGLVHCRREQDGTATGRRTVEFESRGDYSRNFDGLEHSWLNGVCTSTDSSRAVQSIQLPESIVDGVITDSAATSVARVVSACVRSGLDSHETYRSLPLQDDSLYHDRDGYSLHEPAVQSHEQNRALRAQLAEVEAELARLGGSQADHESLVSRRNWLTERLSRSRRVRPMRARHDFRRDGHWHERLASLHDRANSLRARQSELRRWIAELGPDALASNYRDARPDYQHRATVSDQNLRRQLDDLDAQMIRWRRTLLEVRGLRTAITSNRDQWNLGPISSLDETSLRRRRLDGFLHAVDRYDRSRSWNDLYPENYRPLHQLDDIDHRIDSATRQIDWLLQRYANPESVQSTWFEPLPETIHYRSTTNLGDALRAIREDLRQVQRSTVQTVGHAEHYAATEREELRRSENWLVSAIDRLNQHRETLLRGYATDHQAELADWSRDSHYHRHLLHDERNTRLVELDRVTAELDACLSEAAEVRRSMRTLPVIDSWYDDASGDDSLLGYNEADREAWLAELRAIDERLASTSRLQKLRSRRAQLIEQMRGVRQPIDTQSPLADVASRWLVRLSAGRLQRVAWPYNQFRSDRTSYHRDSAQRSGVTINGREEHDVPAADRALAVMAVRMAAGDLLARTGRHVPLVFETHREMFGDIVVPRQYDDSPLAYYEQGEHFQSNHPITAALRDYARSGRQVIVLTSNQILSDQLSRVGARAFQIHTERVVHAHRPVWRSDSEEYVGPHPHTYGPREADAVLQRDHALYRRETLPGGPADINRDLDSAWQETYRGSGTPERPVGRRSHVALNGRTDWARDGVDHRDGFYYADTYTTVTAQEPYRYDANGHWVSGQGKATSATPQPAVAGPSAPVKKQAESPFFLSVDSPIDQAPSIDAVAAARLRGLKVTHVNHLMQQDSNRLADALGLANVDAATIRRWKSECRLVCRVPQLRGFDARVLVGCGVTSPAELASIHPVDLLQDVEAFLATQRGQQILLSGSSHELSRITSWIAAANSSSDHDLGGLSSRRGDRKENDYAFDSDRYEYEYEHDSDGNRTGRRRRIIRTMNRRDAESNGTRSRSSRRGSNGRRSSTRNGVSRSNGQSTRSSSNGRSNGGSGYGIAGGSGRGQGAGNGSGRGTGEGSGRSRRRRSRRSVTPHETTPRDVVQYERDQLDRQRAEREQADLAERNRTNRVRSEREPRDYVRSEREPRDYARTEREPRELREREESERELRFYLQRESPVVDAPSIGARMAERLNAIGIYTVDDLLNADPDTVAAELDHRRIDSDTILQWQQQATLVCRVPMLRGHDAQLLVMAEVTTPEELSAQDAEELFGIIDPIARSSDGKRIVRGGKLPDLEEVTEWIGFAEHMRELRAA